ncbi:MAG: sulfatase, partial [Gammaproteobacteria bacterium]|nr:sulfatase [Gammaproteobacteria bacterium]
PDKQWLYNLAEDPTEQDNLAASHSEKRQELMALLEAHQASAREPLYPYVAEMAVAIDKTLADYFESGDEYIHWPN